jgi:hypothetical protein
VETFAAVSKRPTRFAGVDANAVRIGGRSSTVEIELTLILSVLAGAALLISPLAAFAMSSFLLINLGRDTTKGVRHILAVVAAVSLAMMAGARPLQASDSNDIEGYYDVYQSLAEGDLSELAHFGGGFEVALPLLMALCAAVLPPLSVNGLMFCFAVSGSLLMFVWVEKTFYAGRGRQSPALLGICIVMLNLYFATQLSRQFLSLIMLLYAFSAVGRTRQAAYLAIASAFHLTAIPFFAIYLLARRGWLGYLMIAVAALLIRLYFAQILVSLDIVPEAIAEKLVYYAVNTDDADSPDIGSLRMVFLLMVISVAAVVAARFKPSPASRAWLAAPWIAAIVHYVLLPIPLASLRATLMVHSVVPGLLAHRMLSGRAAKLLPAVLNLLVVYKIVSFAAAPESANLRSTLAMATSFFS